MRPPRLRLTFGLNFRLFIVVAFGCLFRLDGVAQAMDQGGSPPGVYTQELAKLLTPASKAIKAASGWKLDGEDGVIILDETVTYVKEDGKRVSVYHYIYKA